MKALLDLTELRARGARDAAAPAGARPAAERLTLTAERDALPGSAELAALLSRVPVAGVRLADPVDLSALPDDVAVRIVALLRECASTGARVSWSLVLGAGELDLIPRLDHLPAPDSVTVREEGTASFHTWRSAGTFGLLYFRRGPGFLSVVDQRPESCGETVLADPATVDVFRRALAGCPWSDLTGSPERAAAARDLADRGLILRLGGHCVTLPVHMRSWPLGAALLGGTLASAGKKREDTP